MRKFETYPCINYSLIKAVKATIELTDEEIESVKNMNKKEFAKFIIGRTNVEILDWEANIETEPFLTWDEVTDD